MPSDAEIKAAVRAVEAEDDRANDHNYVASVLEHGSWEEHVARIALSAAELQREGDAGMRHAALSAAEKERVESAIRDVLIDWVGRPWRALLAARCADAALKVITSDPPERIEGE